MLMMLIGLVKPREGRGEGTAPAREAPRQGKAQEGESLLPLWFGRGAGEGTAPPPLFETEKRGCADAAPFSVTFVVA